MLKKQGLRPFFVIRGGVMSPVNVKIEKLIAPTIEALGFELVGCELVASGKGSSTLRVYADGPDGINIDQCAEISRQIGVILDVENPIHGNYSLEVSSPGLERPLFKLEHYRRFIGKTAKVRLRMPQNDRRNFKGEITKVNDTDVILTLEDGTVATLPFTNIDKGHLSIDY
jgi:ribosome maturation factor RimP